MKRIVAVFFEQKVLDKHKPPCYREHIRERKYYPYEFHILQPFRVEDNFGLMKNKGESKALKIYNRVRTKIN